MLTKKEEYILGKIKIGSENDPKKPEFPPDNPKFPATPLKRIDVPGFNNVWLKDESINPTGTHKDRMAWEIIVTYRDFLLTKKTSNRFDALPQFSMISTGAAALAVATALKKYGLPQLKVLMNINTDKKIVTCLEKLGCQVYEFDISRKALTAKEILLLTENEHGFDLTSNEALEPTTRFYDWMGYEIINNSPKYVFVPFGTGTLYENIMNVNKKEVSRSNHDPRFSGNVNVLRNCNFIGATTNNPDTKAYSLYSHHLPFFHYSEQWLGIYKYASYCGPESGVFVVKEEFLEKAMEIAEKNKICCEYSGIAGLALLLQMKNKLSKDDKILVVNTGKAEYT